MRDISEPLFWDMRVENDCCRLATTIYFVLSGYDTTAYIYNCSSKDDNWNLDLLLSYIVAATIYLALFYVKNYNRFVVEMVIVDYFCLCTFW
jgi:uncharacterized membrane protein HdeD (DUF308 family)